MIALAGEVDLRYERLYTYLRDDVTRKHPSVDLALNADERLRRCTHFAADAPLLQRRVVHLIPDPNQAQPPLLAHYLKLDEQIVRLLLRQRGLDCRLAQFCRPARQDVFFHEPRLSEIKQGLAGLVKEAWDKHQTLKLAFCGPSAYLNRCTAQAAARHVGEPLLLAESRLCF